jgi:hypothetical protein
MSKLIAVLLLLMAALAHAQDKLDPTPLEVGTKVELTLAKPYLTAQGARVSTTWREMAGKRLLTVTASGQGPTMIQAVEGERLEGMVAAVDDEWLTLDLGEKQPLLRISRAAILRWETPALPEQNTAPLASEPEAPEGEAYPIRCGVGEKVEITLAKPYLTAEGVRVRTAWTERSGKPLMTVAARGRAATMAQSIEEGRVRGLLAAVDDNWLTLDLGGERPFLRIPRRANAIIHMLPLSVSSEDGVPLPAGHSIRLVSTDFGPDPISGALLTSDAEALRVKVGNGEPIRVRRASIEKFEISRGKGRAAGEGAVLGTLIVGFLGGLAAVSWSGPDASSKDLGVGSFATGFAICAPVGILVGGMIGYAFTTEVWERVPLSVAIVPERRGARAALALRF